MVVLLLPEAKTPPTPPIIAPLPGSSADVAPSADVVTLPPLSSDSELSLASEKPLSCQEILQTDPGHAVQLMYEPWSEPGVFKVAPNICIVFTETDTENPERTYSPNGTLFVDIPNGKALELEEACHQLLGDPPGTYDNVRCVELFNQGAIYTSGKVYTGVTQLQIPVEGGVIQLRNEDSGVFEVITFEDFVNTLANMLQTGVGSVDLEDLKRIAKEYQRSSPLFLHGLQTTDTPEPITESTSPTPSDAGEPIRELSPDELARTKKILNLIAFLALSGLVGYSAVAPKHPPSQEEDY